MIFNEQFLWVTLYKIVHVISPDHMTGIFHGGINPVGILFQSGEVHIRQYAGQFVEPYFIAPDKHQSPFADIFSLGRSLQCTINGFEGYYSESLLKLLEWMQSEISTERPTVRAIMDYIYREVTRERLLQMIQSSDDYVKLYQTYTIEYLQYQERLRNEKLLLDKKFRRIMEIENSIVYKPFRSSTITQSLVRK